MGTDIHAVFQKQVDGGAWVDIPTDYQGERDYQLFAVLADVRNGYGFAGIVTGGRVEPIALPRGLPDMFVLTTDGEHPVDSLELMGRYAKYHDDGEPFSIWMGDHSFSWLYGREMLEWFKGAPTVEHTGIVDRATFEVWDGKSCPREWCGDIEGPNVFKVNDEAGAARNPNWTHRRISWPADLRLRLAYFFDEVARLVAIHGEIRMVFGFDS
jgi:hypothetical protein